MTTLCPPTAEEFAVALRDAAAAGQRIRLGGGFTHGEYGGPAAEADVVLSTQALRQVRIYEPHDLTVSVEAGLPWTDLEALLADKGQILPLDPPVSPASTVGGVVAANLSGPRRLAYGTARDVIIGMRFATVEGKLIDCGGMVVKNVAGLDMAKLLVGSFGTLAAMLSINFRVFPAPRETRTFVFECADVESAGKLRQELASGPLPFAAMDVMSPAAAERAGCQGFTLATRAAGSPTVLDRYSVELKNARQLTGEAENAFWTAVRDFLRRYLSDFPDGVVIRASAPLVQTEVLLAAFPTALCRAGNGVCYGFFENAGAAADWLARHDDSGWRVVVEATADRNKGALPLWCETSNAVDWMRKVKQMFDPSNLLNRGRLHGVL